ncbi:hypothetical protein [Naumannella halotolerans]|uniref:Uncharacterized protein n=1 Tax=Naumannella halotolerans TaxID=993414 RepID=A0A4R7J1Y2_9ACTN|nr:hypothetical protein [Naumannella halotolerans]TDT31130.1 hypothetical protein CLV29_2543 [Naumannella halotolerans]
MTRIVQHFSGDWMLISPSGQIGGRFASRETAEAWLALVESAPVQCPADCIAGEVDHNPEGVARWGQCHLCGGDGWVATCPRCHGAGCSTCSNGLIPADRYDDLAAS